MLGYAAYADRFAGDLAGVRSRLPYLRELGVTYLHLMPLLQPRDGRQRRRLRGRRLPHGAARPRHHRRPARPRRPTCAGTASAWCSTWCSTTSPASTSGRRPRAGGEPALPRLLPRLSRPRAARRLRAHPAGGLPRLRPRQLHLGRRAAGLGLDDLQRLAVGRQLVQPRRASSSTPTSCCSWPTSASRCSGSTPSRSCGSGSAPTARTSPRCTRSPRRCAPWRGSPARRWCSRPRRSSGPHDLVQYLGQGRTTARSATSPTTTALMVQVWSMLATGDARLAAQALRRCRRRRRPRPGSPTSAATTTSAGPSTTATPPPSGSRVTPTARSCPTGTPGRSPGRRRAGWSSRTTRPPATGGSAARRRAWPGSRLRRGCGGGRDQAALDAAIDRLFLAHAIVSAGAASRWSGWGRARPAQRPGLGAGARARGRQPVGAPAADAAGRRRATTRSVDGARPGVHRPATARRPRGPASPTWTPPWPPRCRHCPTRGSCRCSGATRWGRCSACTT